MRLRRRALSAGERWRLSHRLCQRVRNHPLFRGVRRVGIYFPNDGEIDVTHIIRTVPDKQFFLPVLPSPGQRRLWFAPYKPGQRLVPDRFGIPEPINRRRIRAEELNLVLVPLVAFDQSGGRIGMGGGYYDTSLSFVSRPGRSTPVRVIGAAYEFQQVDTIARDEWDIPLHGVMTDRRFVAAKVN